jgi:hypothetical protein
MKRNNWEKFEEFSITAHFYFYIYTGKAIAEGNIKGGLRVARIYNCQDIELHSVSGITTAILSWGATADGFKLFAKPSASSACVVLLEALTKAQGNFAAFTPVAGICSLSFRSWELVGTVETAPTLLLLAWQSVDGENKVALAGLAQGAFSSMGAGK